MRCDFVCPLRVLDNVARQRFEHFPDINILARGALEEINIHLLRKLLLEKEIKCESE